MCPAGVVEVDFKPQTTAPQFHTLAWAVLQRPSSLSSQGAGVAVRQSDARQVQQALAVSTLKDTFALKKHHFAR
jgi:hypothetical protein